MSVSNLAISLRSRDSFSMRCLLAGLSSVELDPVAGLGPARVDDNRFTGYWR